MPLTNKRGEDIRDFPRCKLGAVPFKEMRRYMHGKVGGTFPSGKTN